MTIARRRLDRYEPLMGQALLAEYESVLARSEPFAASPIDEAERDALWAAFASRCRWVRVYYRWRPNLPEEVVLTTGSRSRRKRPRPRPTRLPPSAPVPLPSPCRSCRCT